MKGKKKIINTESIFNLREREGEERWGRTEEEEENKFVREKVYRLSYYLFTLSVVRSNYSHRFLHKENGN